MSLNKDVLFLIFKELNKKSLYLCLFVNRIWCNTAVPILWRKPNPFNKSIDILFNILLLSLSEESRNTLKNHGINLIKETYKRPLFNYINFWKCLDLSFIERMIFQIEKSKRSIVRNEILKLFINDNTNFIGLSISQNLDYQLHHISGFECCFSKLQSFYCSSSIDQNILEKLAKTCKSIKKLKYDIHDPIDYHGIIKLIEVQNNLNDIRLSCSDLSNFEFLEKSLYFMNLLKLEIRFNETNLNRSIRKKFKYLGNLSLSFPNLKILKVRNVPLRIMKNVIEGTKGQLSEITLDSCNEEYIRIIYQNCPYLKYLKLPYLPFYIRTPITEFENLLINCQYLNGLVISGVDNHDKLFEIITRSSPITLFKFDFFSFRKINLKNIKLFFDNLKDRKPILLKINNANYLENTEEKQQFENLVQEYKAKGIIKRYFIGLDVNSKDFEWFD
ncbi:hypothetical protein RhiirA5_428335 [Rhizophagus irregularis]|uniref:F-box domain-containing protein n=2 Tax=Rhizophagus irregularis TaxID=588596 RepID=A0A2I1EYV9_9GLOM|nr:hypothetical protein RhiirA5_428335 [Rhizophagus irregularis]PKC61767.1 hypothetical protein RhiirA1_466060 [Rhizophagus irregularis]PKK59874.1 hypothetical protein RhiirC2_857139 [Rhizophagus irregularis]PKY27310.1 hypothetical protein RhiirB3_529132 [Rhizophagus irregularis]